MEPEGSFKYMARYAATLAYVRTVEDRIPESREHVSYTRAEVDQAEAVIAARNVIAKLGKNELRTDSAL